MKAIDTQKPSLAKNLAEFNSGCAALNLALNAVAMTRQRLATAN
jgi:hypothetical protein